MNIRILEISRFILLAFLKIPKYTNFCLIENVISRHMCDTKAKILKFVTTDKISRKLKNIPYYPHFVYNCIKKGSG